MSEEKETENTQKAEAANANANANSQLDIPELGIFFKRFHCKKITKFVCAWKNENESHVYELRIRQSEGGEYVAIGQTDGNDTFRLYYQSRNFLVKIAKATMRKYLVNSHRRAWKKFRDSQKEQNVPNNSNKTEREELENILKNVRDFKADTTNSKSRIAQFL